MYGLLPAHSTLYDYTTCVWPQAVTNSSCTLFHWVLPQLENSRSGRVGAFKLDVSSFGYSPLSLVSSCQRKNKSFELLRSLLVYRAVLPKRLVASRYPSHLVHLTCLLHFVIRVASCSLSRFSDCLTSNPHFFPCHVIDGVVMMCIDQIWREFEKGLTRGLQA